MRWKKPATNPGYSGERLHAKPFSVDLNVTPKVEGNYLNWSYFVILAAILVLFRRNGETTDQAAERLSPPSIAELFYETQILLKVVKEYYMQRTRISVGKEAKP